MRDMHQLIIYFISLVQFYHVNTASILGLFPYSGKSHYMVFEPLLRKLADRGHNVTVASFYPAKNAPSNFKDVSFEGIAELTLEPYDLGVLELEPLLYKIPMLNSITRGVLEFNIYRTKTLSICESIMNFQPLLDVMKQDYDIVLYEHFFSDCMPGLLHVYGITAPTVAIMSGSTYPWSSDLIGFNDNPSYLPVIFTPFATPMSFLERLENSVTYCLVRERYNYIKKMERAILQKKYGNIPELHELAKNTSLILSNTYHTLNGVKPLVPGLVEVGGMHLSVEKKPIPKFIENFLDESPNGVILFSFGSRIKTRSMPKYKEQIFINVLLKLKQRVIWKFEDSDDDGTLMGNIIKVKWIPQYELLRHDKVIAFICHGGMLGTTEAMSVGKPMIVLPIYGDQPSNAAAAAEAGVGVVLSYRDLNEAVLGKALRRVLSDEMREHARLMSKIWHDRESAPLDKAVFWTEHVIRWNKTTRLYSVARDLPFYQLSLLDVALFITFVITAFLFIIIYVIKQMIKSLKKVNRKSYNKGKPTSNL